VTFCRPFQRLATHRTGASGSITSTLARNQRLSQAFVAKDVAYQEMSVTALIV